MTSVTYKNLSVFAAEQFLEAVSEPSAANLYLMFGRTVEWANDAEPPQANTMPVTFKEVWNHAIAGKRIVGFDMSHVVKRNQWAANTVYTQWDEKNPNIFADNTAFYIVNTNYSVYKCLYNANNANSTVEPTAISTNTVVQTSDGYIWKYMYTIDGAGQYKFTTDDYIPIKTLTGTNGSTQWQVQQNSIDGAIYAIEIEDGGSAYSNTDNITFTITGDGSQANITIGVNTTSNVINSAVVTAYGSGYSYADIEVSGGGGSGAILRPLIGYPGGHGSDPLYELGGSSVMINVRFDQDEDGELATSNDFRQIAIIKDPLMFSDSNVSSNSIINQSYVISVTGSGPDYIQDEIVYQGQSLQTATFIGTVYDYNSANGLLKLINTTNSPTNETLIGANSTASKFISSVVTPDLEKYTGKLLYVDNIKPIIRNPDQTEDIKLVVKF